MKSLYLLSLLIVLFSCSNDKDCTNDILGTYQGTCISQTANYEGQLTIFESPPGESDVFFSDGISHGGVSGYMGNLSSNCNTITVPSQFVTNTNGLSFSISGTIHINGSTLTGDMIMDDGVTQKSCTLSLMKN